MSSPKVNSLMQKLSFLNVYSSLLVPAVIGLVAVFILLFSGILGGKLIEQIEEESVSIGRKVKSGLKGTVSRNQWKVEQSYQQVYRTDANHISLLGIQSTQRELLSYKLFPEAKERNRFIFDRFGEEYRKKTDAMFSGINAADCPSESELERYLKDSGSGSSGRGRFERLNRRRSSERSKSEKVNSMIKDVLCQSRAESSSVYGNAMDISGYEYWAEYRYTGEKEAVHECWYWQLAYWIIEDVIDTIGSTNSGSKSVLTSPVKRILSVDFSPEGTVSEKPFYTLSEEEGIAKSFTGRHTNEEIDVVHFSVSVLISNKDILRFMEELCSSKTHIFKGYDGKDKEQSFKHNQITILKSNISAIDRNDEEHELYRYGDAAVVELYLVCEYVFSRKGYEAIMPESVAEDTVKIEEEN